MDTRTFFLLQYDVALTMSDELILAAQSDEQLRYAPSENQHSLAWLLWHSARWEDIAATMLQQNTYQVFEQDGWFDRLGVERHDIGMFMGAEACRAFNLRINLPALRLYRTDVEQRTRLTVDALRDEDLDEWVSAQHFRQVLETGVIGEQSAPWLERFLANRPKAWWLSSIIWHQTAYVLGEAASLRRQAGQPQHVLPEWPF
ncbi:hypothetical protein KSC_073040 [Ktedonobacter sp. SOSP1-52]|uniref:DinB family protein n=1 Tax=Ktedonobacter sp. SOSP1-52 TaxID=2778366 RepID=UPI001914FD59|nr:DinB family protein [Ktedonobacter sp. SOSP1-52]GHO68412.1 hypothetical protein KSC_073040 [Ktedonobacter sp. SOSP1-52]